MATETNIIQAIDQIRSASSLNPCEFNHFGRTQLIYANFVIRIGEASSLYCVFLVEIYGVLYGVVF